MQDGREIRIRSRDLVRIDAGRTEIPPSISLDVERILSRTADTSGDGVGEHRDARSDPTAPG